MNSTAVSSSGPRCASCCIERGPVRKAGERVDARAVLELGFEGALLGHVAEVQHERPVVAAGQARVGAALLLELVGEVPLARDVVGEA